MKFFVFGIDGGSYDLIFKFGKTLLPNLFKLISEGTYGELISTVPPHTAPGWASIVTGCSPGTHGIYQFWSTQPNFMEGFMGSQDYGVPTIWEILNRVGISTGLVNIPMTYPPTEVDGYMLSWPLSKTLRYSYPKGLLKELKDNGGHYLPDIYSMFTGDLHYIDEAIEIVTKRVKSVKYLMKKYPQDFFMVVFPEVDRISHFCWKSMEAGNETLLGDAIKRIYVETDKALGELIKDFDEDCIKIVLSDHGFGKGEVDFYTNYFLYKHNFLNLMDAEVNDQIDGVMVFNISKQKKKINWRETIAYMAAPGSYGININLKGRQREGVVDLEDYENICHKIISLLQELKDKNGNKVFSAVKQAKDVYQGKSLKGAPDIILIPTSYGTMVQHKFGNGHLYGSPEQNGMHRQEGFYVISGENINKNLYQKAKLEDIVPTILVLLGIDSLPPHIEGNAVKIIKRKVQNKKGDIMGMFEDGSNIATGDSSYSSEEKEEILDRLKTLGYL